MNTLAPLVPRHPSLLRFGGALLVLLGAFVRPAPAETPSAPRVRPYALTDLARHGIPPLLDGVATREQWEAKRKALLALWLDTMGGLPTRPPARWRVIGEEILADHIRQKIVFESLDGDPVPAYLLIPKSVRDGKARAPAILALHSTLPAGKTSVATAEGMRNRTYGFELVSRGYVVLAPDDLTAGERIYPGRRDFDAQPFYERYPKWSTVGKNIVDHQEALDVLEQLPFVDAARIGVIGHSFGGYNAYFLASVDDRVKVVVSSCGLNPFTDNAAPSHWGYRAFPYTHLPRISADLARGVVPFEFNEILALTAPRPFFVYAAQQDHLFPHWQAVGACLVDVSRLYGWLGRPEDFVSYLGNGDHDFPPEIRRAAYDFLDHWLKRP